MRENNEINESKWIKNRKTLAWEPEILISGIVLIGLLQIPKYLDELILYINDYGPSIFLFSDVDEVIGAVLKTGIFFLIAGLIINLITRSVWVVMISMSYLLPKGYQPQKFGFYKLYEQQLLRFNSFERSILKLDEYCSLIYSTTFLLFMLIVGVCFFLLTVSGFFMLVYSLVPVRSEQFNQLINFAINAFILLFGGLSLIDFLTLGWFKKWKWSAKFYYPIYRVVGFLTLSPLYRNIYYGLISKFNRWKIFAGFIFFIFLVVCVVNIMQGNDFLINQNTLHQSKIGVTTYDGYYEDKNPEKISSWIHIPSAVVTDNVLEIFVGHKVALEDSIFDSFERAKKITRAEVLSNDSLRLAAMNNFYRLTIDGQLLDDVQYEMINYTKYKQMGLLTFLPLDSLQSGTHTLDLQLNMPSKPVYARVMFYKAAML